MEGVVGVVKGEYHKHSACVTPCWIFIRSFVFIYIRVLRGPTLFAPVHPLEPLPFLTDPLNDTRLETLCHYRRVGKEKN